MKRTLIVIWISCQLIAYGQIDNLIMHQLHGPDYSETIYPEEDGFIYDQYVGGTIAGFSLADGWRRDTINGGYNKEMYDNPYMSSLRFEKKQAMN
jgi:hypothetical protein